MAKTFAFGFNFAGAKFSCGAPAFLKKKQIVHFKRMILSVLFAARGEYGGKDFLGNKARGAHFRAHAPRFNAK